MCYPARRKTSHQFVLPLFACSTILFLIGCASGTNPAPPRNQSSNPVPTVASITPATIATGTKDTILTINGTGFVQGSVVRWNQSSRPTTFVNSGQLTAALADTDTTTAGSAQVNVINPTASGGSSAITIIILVGAPQITSLTPDSIVIGSPDTVVTVRGVGFVSKSSVTVNGAAPRTTKFVSSSELQFTLAASELTLSGFEQVSVANPDGTSAPPFELTVLYPSPTLTSINPSAVNATDPPQTLTVTGTWFTFASLVAFNGTPQATTFVNSTTLTVPLNPADPSLAGNVQVTVKTPPPGGGATSAAILSDKYPALTLASVSPDSVTAGTSGVSVFLQGTGFTPASKVQVNGSPVSDVVFIPSNPLYGFASALAFTLPDADVVSVGTVTITASNPGTADSNAVTISVVPNPAPTVSSVYPPAAALGSADLKVTVNGQNFVASSVVQWNGQSLNTSYANSSQLNAVIPAQDLQALGNNEITVSSPSPGGGVSASQVFTTYLGLPANALVYNPVSQLLYAATPSSAGPQLGNSVVSIDPATGVLGTPIFVGSEPDKMALSSDGKKLWVSLHGAAAIREVDLTTQTAGLQFSLGGGVGIYSPPSTAAALAIVPSRDDSVAVAFASNFSSPVYLAIYDNGVARPKTEPLPSGTSLGTNAIAFDSTGTKLYQVGQGFGYATMDSTGITQTTQLNPSVNTYNLNDFRINNGAAYLPSGIVLDLATGNQSGEFLMAPGQPASGPIVPDSTTGKTFILVNPNFSQAYQINVYDQSTQTLQGSIPVSGVNGFYSQGISSTFQRWGQNGLAFSTGSQVYILRSSLIRDLSTSLADLSLTGSAPSASTTGTNLTFTLTVSNSGPVTASPVTLIDNIPDGSLFVSATSTAGTCSGTTTIYCDVGDLASGSAATVQVTVTPLNAATLSNTAIVSAPQGDPNPANNLAVTNSTATGTVFNGTPVLTSISPEFVQAGSPSFTLTVNGSNFTSASTVQLGSVALPTTLVNANQLSATVDASDVASLGWAWVFVNSPAPGNGNSASLPLSVYQVLSLDSNRMHYDPFSRKLYLSVPSTATQVEGNSIVSVDPYTGTIGTPLFVGSEPNRVAETGDGRYLYVGLDGSQSLTRVDLTNFTQGPVYPLVLPNSQTRTTALDLAVAPTNDNLLAINVGAQNGLFDIAGSTGTFRPNLTDYYTGSNLAFWTDNYLFSFDTDTSGAEFFRWEVTSTGLALVNNTGYTLNGIGGSAGGYELLNNTIYGFSGGVVNPLTTPPTQIAQFTISSAGGGPPQSISGSSVAADPAAGRVFFLGETLAGSANPALLSYDSNRYVLLDAPTFVGSPQGQDLVRWGRDGLAWHSANGAFGNNTPGAGQLFLVRGPFVLPQWGTPNPTPVLSSLSPSSAPAGIGSGTLVVTGSNFVPGAVVMWNGSERETTFVNSGKLTVAVPAADVSSVGTIAITVNNPGTASSNQLTLQIH